MMRKKIGDASILRDMKILRIWLQEKGVFRYSAVPGKRCLGMPLFPLPFGGTRSCFYYVVLVALLRFLKKLVSLLALNSTHCCARREILCCHGTFRTTIRL